MKLNIVTKNFESSDGLKSYVEKQIAGRVIKYLPEAQVCAVLLTCEGSGFHTHCDVIGDGYHVHVRTMGSSWHLAVDLLSTKLRNRIKRSRERHGSRSRQSFQNERDAAQRGVADLG